LTKMGIEKWYRCGLHDEILTKILGARDVARPSVEIADDATVGDLRRVVAAQIGRPAGSLRFTFGNRVVNDDVSLLSSAGITDGSLVGIYVPVPTQPAATDH
jgi:hypothetical protein